MLRGAQNVIDVSAVVALSYVAKFLQEGEGWVWRGREIFNTFFWKTSLIVLEQKEP